MKTGLTIENTSGSDFTVNLPSRPTKIAQCFSKSSIAPSFLTRSKLTSGVAGLLLGLSLSAVHAAPVPSMDMTLDLNAREKEFVVFMDALFQKIGVPLVADEAIEGTISGRFNGTAAQVIDEVSSAFNVRVYYDGAVAHLYNANQLARQLLPVSTFQARKVIEQANRLQLPDDDNRLRADAGGLLVSGTPRFMEQIEQMVESVAKASKAVAARPARSAPAPVVQAPDTNAMMYKVYRLRFAWANDTTFQVGNQSVTVPGVASILKKLVSDQSIPMAGSTEVSGRGRGTLDGLRGQGLAEGAQPQAENNELGGRSSSSDGLTRIVADTRLNAVIVSDRAERLSAYDALIESLDVESQMVEIEATIIDINTDKVRELGINWRAGFTDGDVLFGQGTAADQSLLPGSPVAAAQGRGGVLSFMLGEPGDFLGRIRALEERGAARVVSKPHVTTLSDVEAVLGASTEFFVRVAGNEEVDLFNVPVGTFLRVTPHVFEQSGRYRIKLLVNIEDGAQSGGQSVDSIPVVERANINTQAVINEGDSLLIGGLVRESYTKSDYRVPVLGSIPGLGRLFRTERNTANRVERLFMITPRVATGGGFNSTSELPGLVGTSEQIVADAARRVDSSAPWAEKPEQPYWPDEVSAAALAASNELRSGAKRRPASVVSPFTVKVWPVATSAR